MNFEENAEWILSKGVTGTPLQDPHVEVLAHSVNVDGTCGVVSFIHREGGEERYDHVLLYRKLGRWQPTGTNGATFLGSPSRIHPAEGARVWMSGAGPVSGSAFGTAAFDIRQIRALDRHTSGVLSAAEVTESGYWSICWDNDFGDREAATLEAVNSVGESLKIA